MAAGHPELRSRVRRYRASTVVLLLTLAFVPVGSPATEAAEVNLVPSGQIGQSGHAELYGWGLATAPDGTILVGDYWNFRIARYAPDGTFLETVVANQGEGITQHQSPYGIAVDPVSGDIVFGDVDGAGLPGSPSSGGHNVDRYDAAGNYVTSWGTRGAGVDKYKYPSYVAISAESVVYIADQWDHNVVATTLDGVELFAFGQNGGGDGEFRQPRGIGIDANDHLYVADNYNQRIQVFDKDGNFQRIISGPGSAPGLLGNDLRGVAVDQVNGWLYVVDTTTAMVSKFDLDGAFLTRWGGYGNTPGQFVHGGRGVTVDHDGNVWVGDMGAFRVQKFTPDGTFLLEIPIPAAGPPDGGFNQPRGVAVDSQGNIFVTDTHNWRVQKFAPDGTFLTAWGTRGSDQYKFNYQRGIAIDLRDDSVVVADTDNHKVKKYTGDGVFLWDVGGYGTELGQFKNFHSLAVGPDGRIYVADTLNRRVQVLDEGGNPTHAFGVQGNAAGEFQFPRAITVDSDETIWVADSVKGTIQHFANDGTFLDEFGSFGSEPDQFLRAAGVEVDDTYVYVTDADTDEIKIWRKDGTVVTAFGGSGTQPGQMLRPHGIQLHNGSLYVVEQTGERVQSFLVQSGGPSDTTPPDGQVEVPSSGQQVPLSPLTMSGSATDDVAVAAVDIAIRNTATLEWWTGSGWGAFQYHPAALDSPASAATGWSFDWTPPAAGSFALLARATDTSGNSDPEKPWVPFGVYESTPDTTPPDATVDVPTPNETYSGPLVFAGDSEDDIGVAALDVAIRNRDNSTWWTGSDWGAFTWLGATLNDPGATTTSWTYDWSPPGSGNLALLVRAKDTSGNVDPTKPWVPFVVE